MRAEQNLSRIEVTPLLQCFDQSERHVLRQLHEDYQVGRDLLGKRELEQLRFYRWLYRAGRLTP